MKRRVLVMALLLLPSIATGREGLPLRGTDPLSLGVEAGVSAGLLGAAFLIPAPEACRWCEVNGFDRSIRDTLLAPSPRLAGAASDWIAFGATGVAGLAGVLTPALLDSRYEEAAQNAVTALNATMMTIAINRAVKVAAARRRPAFALGDPAGFSPSEENVSFFSGHTSLVFSIAASTTTVSFLRGYRSAPYLAAGTGALALSAGILRIAADAHWATDVLVGAGAGTAVGVLMPLLLHSRR